jgi:hypothetical protein
MSLWSRDPALHVCLWPKAVVQRTRHQRPLDPKAEFGVASPGPVPDSSRRDNDPQIDHDWGFDLDADGKV